MYYTGKGDKGTSKLFNSASRINKSEQIFSVLGTLDELNSFVGFCSTLAGNYDDLFKVLKIEQNRLFSLQAHFAGARLGFTPEIIAELESSINNLSKKIKPRNSFVVPGGSQLSAALDVARTLARRAEREALGLREEEKNRYNQLSFVYLNRLSSWFYVLARYANDLAGVDENAPQYL